MTAVTQAEHKSDTREKLILVAIRMFAEQGFSGVSMRNINSAAGTRNSSAVHYHFGSKMGIIEAVMEKLNSQLRPIFDQITGALDTKAEQGRLQAEDVAMAIQLPFWVLYCTPEYGRSAVRLSARLMLEADAELKALYNRYLQEPVGRMLKLMTRLQPNKDPHHLKFQIVHCFMATISGLATIDLLDSTPLGDIRFEQDAEMMMVHIFHLAQGLGCEQPDYAGFDMNFWSRFSHFMAMTPAQDAVAADPSGSAADAS
ncbi:MAG: hypothetical protein CML06_11780 [Pseudomonadales bacterium]|nr:hypothetical protein [Pseudomonadales bacterium]